MAATRQITIDEFASLSLDGPWELVDGEIRPLNPTGGESGWVSGEIFGELWRFVHATRLGWVFGADTGFVLFPDKDTVRSPDAAVVLRDRLDRPPRGFVPLAPDLAFEVLSPSDLMSEALGKVGMYLDAGASSGSSPPTRERSRSTGPMSPR
ncbi:MAG: Uma2 family endonuclease [Thermomicrobiales bacterium]